MFVLSSKTSHEDNIIVKFSIFFIFNKYGLFKSGFTPVICKYHLTESILKFMGKSLKKSKFISIFCLVYTSTFFKYGCTLSKGTNFLKGLDVKKNSLEG